MKEQGFTLVELLFALVAGSLLLITLSWAIRSLEDQYGRHAHPNAAERIEATAPFLIAEIGRALPYSPGSQFAGDSERMTLAVPPPQALGAVGSLRLLLTVVTDHGRKALAARFAGRSPGQPLPSPVLTPVILATGFRDIRFSYLRRATDPPAMLPRLVTIQFEDDDGTILPLGIEPRLTMGTDCVFDTIAQACRR